MGGVVAFLAFAGGLAATMAALAWWGSRIRRRGVGGELMGPFDEIWHPAAHRFRIEIRAQDERLVPMPSPDDPWHRGRGQVALSRSSAARR